MRHARYMLNMPTPWVTAGPPEGILEVVELTTPTRRFHLGLGWTRVSGRKPAMEKSVRLRR